VVGRQKVLVMSTEGCLSEAGAVTGTFLLGDGDIGFVVGVERLLESACGS